MAKMLTRDDTNGIIAWDGAGNVKFTSTEQDFFRNIHEGTYFSAEGLVKNETEIEIKEIEICTHANDNTLVSGAKPRLN